METAPTAHDPAVLAAIARGPAIADLGLLLRAAARLDRRMDAELRAECGLSHTMFEVLIMLCRAGGQGVAQRDLADGLTLTSGGTTRLVDRMEQAGLVRRSPSPDDRRITLVAATGRGVEAFLQAGAVHARVVDALFLGPVEPADRPHLIAALRAIVAAPA